MSKIPMEWLLLLIVVVAADNEEDNLSFERIDISNIDINEINFADSGGNNKTQERNKTQGKSKDVDDFRPRRVPTLRRNKPRRRNKGPAGGGLGNQSAASGGYGFYRSLGARGRWRDTRRVFGGAATRLEDFPEVCVLLDRFMAPRCSGSVLTPYWILTAAHCITPNLGYAKYNTRTPTRADDGGVVALRFLYKHPDYKVVQEDIGRGMDVTVLHHDMGLAHTRGPMKLAMHSPTQPLRAILSYDAEDLINEDVQVLGFGRTEASDQGEELLTVFLKLVPCDRSTWQRCVCGVARAQELPSGVCSGDSGGPVIYHGVQIGVTSMGPLSCAAENSTWPGRATSVFTAVFPYRDIINRTISEAERTMARSIPSHCARSARSLLASLAATLLATMLLLS